MAKFRWKNKKGAKQALQNEQDKVTSTEETAAQSEEQTAQETTENAQEKQETASAEEWEAALRTAVAQRDEYLALAQRTQADFANFRRRNQSVRTDALEEGARETVTAFLPVLDNLERAVAAIGEDDESALGSGVKMTLKHLKETLTKLGVEEIPASAGDPFDPEMHNAVMRTEEGEPGTVIECFEKGYCFKGRVIRYASVKVCVE